MQKLSDKIFLSSFIILAGFILVKISSFIRELSLAYAYGASIVSDSFIAASAIPGLLLGFITSGIGNTFIAQFSYIETKERQNKYTSSLFTLFSLISIVLTIAILLFPRFFLMVIASKAPMETIELGSKLLRWMSICTIPLILTSILKARLQIHGKFFISTCYHVIINVCVIAGILSAKRTETTLYMAYGMIFGELICFIILMITNYRTDLRVRFIIDFHEDYIHKFFILIAPIVLSTALTELNKVVDRTMASSLAVGTITMLSYSSKLTGLFNSTIVFSVVTAMYPTLVRNVANGGTDAMKKTISKVARVILLFILPVLIGAIILAKPLTRIVFERGDFTRVNTLETSAFLRWYAPTIITAGATDIQSRAFYAIGNTRRPALISAGCVFLNILLNVFLIKPLGGRGLALSTSIAGVAATVLLSLYLHREIGSIQIFKQKSDWLKLGISLIIMSLFVLVGVHFFQLMNNDYMKCLVQTAMLIICAVFIYWGMLSLLKMEAARIRLGNLIKRIS